MMIEIPVFKLSLIIGLLWMIAAALKYLFFSEQSDLAAKKNEIVESLPKAIKVQNPLSAYLGWAVDLKTAIYLPDKVRSRHVHIIGATGSGKTESVLLNLIDQDASRGYPMVILDAKGDQSFVNFLKQHPRGKDQLIVFDPGSPKKSIRYNPLGSGPSTDAALRLFNSMTWSEEFYKTRCREMLLKVVAAFDKKEIRLTLVQLQKAFASKTTLAGLVGTTDDPAGVTDAEFSQLAGLTAQINQLCHGSLGIVLSEDDAEDDAKRVASLDIRSAIQSGKIIYFRLPALVDPETTKTLGRLLIAELAQYSADIQAGGHEPKFTPVFLDEFGSLACPSFLELIAKARSAGLALHFSHQSMGDLAAAGESFASQVTDNSSTKIVLRIYDPETAEMIAKTFGTQGSSKETRQLIKSSLGSKEETGAMSVRDVKEFRADPDKIKSLPTGHAYVLMNHALRPEGSSGDVFFLSFPRLANYKEETN